MTDKIKETKVQDLEASARKEATEDFLSTVITPLDSRTEMGAIKLGKMCGFCCYGG
jgi:hypothetical protein